MTTRLHPAVGIRHGLTGDTVTIERQPGEDDSHVVIARRTDGELVTAHDIPDGVTPEEYARSIVATWGGRYVPAPVEDEPDATPDEPAVEPEPAESLPRPITAADIQPGDVVTDRDGDRWTARAITRTVMAHTPRHGVELTDTPTEVAIDFGPLTLVERPEPAPVEVRVEYAVRYAWQAADERRVEVVEDGREAALGYLRWLLDRGVHEGILVSRTVTATPWTVDGAQ